MQDTSFGSNLLLNFLLHSYMLKQLKMNSSVPLLFELLSCNCSKYEKGYTLAYVFPSLSYSSGISNYIASPYTFYK